MEQTRLKIGKYKFLIKTEESYIVYDPEKEDKWEVNDTGALIVKSLMERASWEEIKNKIAEEYDIGPEEAEQSLQKYVELLVKEGIISQSEG